MCALQWCSRVHMFIRLLAGCEVGAMENSLRCESRCLASYMCLNGCFPHPGDMIPIRLWGGCFLDSSSVCSHTTLRPPLALPVKFMNNLLDTLESWKDKGMVAVRELRSTAGRVSWLAGILPAAKWVLAVFYTVLSEREKEVAKGLESERRAGAL